MVIVKTERLQAERGRPTATSCGRAGGRLLAMEQRMVRAEVVFLSGGEVADEVEEAAQSHELQEGRLENTGRAEMLRAINEMSRAEAHLNAETPCGRWSPSAAALAALQRAFDRRRYFLRTMPSGPASTPSATASGDRSRARVARTRKPPDRVPGRRSPTCAR